MNTEGSITTIDSEFHVNLKGEFNPIPERGEKTESAKIKRQNKNERIKILKTFKEIQKCS